MFSNVSSTVRLAPVLRFNLSAPQVDILPKADNGTVVPVPVLGFRLIRAAQINASGAVTLPATFVNGTWSRVNSNALNASQSFIYACRLAFPNGTALRPEPATLRLQLYIFNRSLNITLDRLLAYNTTPAYSKMTLSISHWPWLEAEQHAADRLQVRLRITPPFNGTLQAGNESNGLVQTFTLTGQALPPFIEKLLNGRQLVRRVRLVDAVELDSQVVVTNTSALSMLGAERSKVDFALNITTSELVLSFGHFNSTLVYDPDFGVLLEGKENGGGDGNGVGSDDNTALIVSVSVLVPVAVLVVVAVVVGALVLTRQARARFTAAAVQSTANINFSSEGLGRCSRRWSSHAVPRTSCPPRCRGCA